MKDSEDGLPEEEISREEKVHKKAESKKRKIWEDKNIDESEVEDDSDDLYHRFGKHGHNGLNSDIMNEKSVNVLKEGEMKLKKLRKREQKGHYAKVEKILGGTAVSESVTSRKIKCRSCGYKRRCHLEALCKSKVKTCFACSKQGHFPKSQNCKAQRKKRRQSTVRYGCLTLRQFLKIAGYKLTREEIPYSKLAERKTVIDYHERSQISQQKLINSETLKHIQDRIQIIENRIWCDLKLANCAYATKFCLASYFLFNLQHILIRNQTFGRVQNSGTEQYDEGLLPESTLR